MYYNICEICGAHLDPGEPCDCQRNTHPEGGQAVRERKVFFPAEHTKKEAASCN